MPSRVERILMKYDKPISSLGLHLREYLRTQLKGCIEMPDEFANMVAYGFGTGYIDIICAIIPSKKGIKLRFNRGSELPDPEKLSTGSVKVHRYVDIKSPGDIQKSAITALLHEGIKACKVSIESRASK